MSNFEWMLIGIIGLLLFGTNVNEQSDKDLITKEINTLKIEQQAKHMELEKHMNESVYEHTIEMENYADLQKQIDDLVSKLRKKGIIN